VLPEKTAMTTTNPTEKNDRGRDFQTPIDVGISNLPAVHLTDQEYRLCQLISKARALTYADIDGGVVHGEQDSENAHLTGTVGEYALQKMTDNLEQAIYIRGDPGYDLTDQGYTLDVKCTETHLTYPDLIVPASQDLVADLFVLAHRIGEKTVRIVGYAPCDQVKDKTPERYPGHRLNRVVRPDEMRAP